MKSMKELVTEVSKREGLKVQVGVGNIREVLSVLSDLTVSPDYKNEDGSSQVGQILTKNGELRRKKIKK